MRFADRVYIEVQGSNVGVTRKGYGDGALICRDDPNDPKVGRENYKWIIDFENSELHDAELGKISNILRPVIHINNGEFYTHKVSEDKYICVRGNTTHRPFGHVAETIGARINLGDEDHVIVRIGTQSWTLPRKPGATYEVHFENLRQGHGSHDTEHRVAAPPAHPGSSDLQYYYQAFDVPATEAFDFEPEAKRGDPPLICYATGGRRTTWLP